MKTESFENLFKKSMSAQSLNRLELARLHQLIQNPGKGQTRRALLRQRFSVEDRKPEQGTGGSSNVVHLGKSLESRRANQSIIKSSVASIFLVVVVLLALPIWVSQPLIQKISEEIQVSRWLLSMYVLHSARAQAQSNKSATSFIPIGSNL